MKKLLSLVFATMVVFTLSMPALASGNGSGSSSAAKMHKNKTAKPHKTHKTTASKPS